MSDYQQALLAAGIDPEQAARDAWADTLQMWRNREHPAYGRYEYEETLDGRYPSDDTYGAR